MLSREFAMSVLYPDPGYDWNTVERNNTSSKLSRAYMRIESWDCIIYILQIFLSGFCSVSYSETVVHNEETHILSDRLSCISSCLLYFRGFAFPLCSLLFLCGHVPRISLLQWCIIREFSHQIAIYFNVDGEKKVC